MQSDAKVVDRCIQFFTTHGEFEKAIDLLVKVGKVISPATLSSLIPSQACVDENVVCPYHDSVSHAHFTIVSNFKMAVI